MKDNGGKSMFEGYMSRETPCFAEPSGMVYQSVSDVPCETTERDRVAEAAKRWAGKGGWAEAEFQFQEGMGGSTLDPRRDVIFSPGEEPEKAPEPVFVRTKHRR